MTSAYVLIVAVLLLGGILAALGDRLGSKVGKARLSLFKLRPKQTAVVVTVMTGTLIAGSSLAILFGFSKPLRQGVFQLDEIQEKRKAAQKALRVANEEKAKVEGELQEIDQKFTDAQDKLNFTSKQARQLKRDIAHLTKQQTDLQTQRDVLKRQSSDLQDKVKERDRTLASKEAEIDTKDGIIQQRSQKLQSLEQRQTKLQTEIDQQDVMIRKRDQTIRQKDQAIASKDQALKSLDQELDRLQKLKTSLEDEYTVLRNGDVAIVRGQPLAFGVVRVLDPNNAVAAVDQLLNQANQAAIIATRLTKVQEDERVVRITESQVQQLVKQLKDGGDYVVRIIAAGNYVQGERRVQVLADAVPHRKIFRQGDVVAGLSLEDLADQTSTKSRTIDFLLGAAQFRARQAGILGEIQVGNGEFALIQGFSTQLAQLTEPVTEIRAIAIEDTFNSGPLRLQLVALRDGKIVLKT